jgi:anti-sigma B factor antagonist
MLTIDVDDEGRVAIAGRLYAERIDDARAALDRLEGRVVLDCRRLDYLSSAGLGLLLQTHRRLHAAGGGLRLVGVGHHLRDVIAYSGFDRVVDVELVP